MRRALVAAVVLLALAGCSSRPVAAVSTPASVSTPAPSATPADLSSVDSSLATVDGAVNQSQSDLSSGDASAATNDNQ